MGLAVDLTDAPDSDDDMDTLEAAEAEAIDGPSIEDAPEPETNPDQYGRMGTQFQSLDSYPSLPFDTKQAYPLTGSPVFLGTELECPDDPLKPGLGTANTTQALIGHPLASKLTSSTVTTAQWLLDWQHFFRLVSRPQRNNPSWTPNC